jgi:hypothetical protein
MTSNGTTVTIVTGLAADTDYYLRARHAKRAGRVLRVWSRSGQTRRGCLPSRTQSFADGITYTGASVHALIEPGGAPVTSYGVVWSSAEAEPLLDSPLSMATINSVSFTHVESVSTTLSNLSAGTAYYYRYYSGNSTGISYGPVESFKTLSTQLPVVSTSTTVTAYHDWADAGARVESDGTGSKALAQIGVLFSDNSAPELSTPGVVVSSMSYIAPDEVRFPSAGLAASTGYYTRAFGSPGTARSIYGASVFFTNPSPSVPGTRMDSFMPVTDTSAEIFGSVFDDGGDALDERGFVFGTSPPPVNWWWRCYAEGRCGYGSRRFFSDPHRS